jgi:hypothetical protein
MFFSYYLTLLDSKSYFQAFTMFSTKAKINVEAIAALIQPHYASAVSYLPNLPTALRTLLFSQLLDAILIGFELELYESEEWERIWWVGERISQKSEVLWAELNTMEKGPRAREHGIVHCLCKGSILVCPSVTLLRWQKLINNGLLDCIAHPIGSRDGTRKEGKDHLALPR